MVIFDVDGSRLELDDEGQLLLAANGTEVGAGLDLDDLVRLIAAATAALRAQAA